MNAATRTIGQLAVAVAVAVVLAGSAAGVAEAGFKSGDYGSRAEFEHYCKLEGGTFSEDSLGNLICSYPGGAFHECDSNGNDCWLIPEPRRKPPKGHQGNGGGNVGGGGLAKSQDSSQEFVVVDDGSRHDGREGKRHKNTK